MAVGVPMATPVEYREDYGMRDFTFEYTKDGEEIDLDREQGEGCGVRVWALEYTGDGDGSASSPVDGIVRGDRGWVTEYIVDSGDTDAMFSRIAGQS